MRKLKQIVRLRRARTTIAAPAGIRKGDRVEIVSTGQVLGVLNDREGGTREAIVAIDDQTARRVARQGR